MCKQLDILPVENGFDDDLYYLNIDFKEKDNNFLKLKIFMKYIDFTIGNIENNINLEEFSYLNNIELNNDCLIFNKNIKLNEIQNIIKNINIGDNLK
jgi:hypothetical protein